MISAPLAIGALFHSQTWQNPYTLECQLPPSPTSGTVKVTLSLHQEPGSPQFGHSCLWFRYNSEHDHLSVAPASQREMSNIRNSLRYELLRVMAGQEHDVTSKTWDFMIPHVLQNVSLTGREFLHHATQPAQPTNQFSSIDAGELEGWTLRFLDSLADKPSWEDTVSLVNAHHQTLAHLAVLFRYTALLKKVAQWGIDVDVQDVNGFTALHCAYLCGDLDSVGILKGYGADEDIQDNLGRRPLDMYISSMNDPGRGSPSSDRTSSSVQRPSASSKDWERVLMASSQPSSFSGHGTTIDFPASKHQSLHTRESTTNLSVTPASISTPSHTDSNWFLTDDRETIERLSGLNLSDSSISVEHTSSSSHLPDVSVAAFQYARSQEQELKELEKRFNDTIWQCNRGIQSLSSWQETMSKPRRTSPCEHGDRDSPGEYEWCRSNSVGCIYRTQLASACLFTRCFRLYPDPKASEATSLALSPPANHKGGIHEQTSHPQSTTFFSQLALPALGANNHGAPPVLAGTGHKVGAVPDVVEKYFNKEEMDVGRPKTRGQGQPHSLFKISDQRFTQLTFYRSYLWAPG